MSKAIVDNFSTHKGVTYGVAGAIDWKSVDTYIEGEGYTIEEVISKGRYYILKISKSGVYYVFKISTSEGINETLKNELSWNLKMFERSLKTDFLRVPKIVDSGSINGSDYIITEYFPGSRFRDELSKVSDSILESLVKTTLFIDSQKDVLTYKNEVEDEKGIVITSVKDLAEKYIKTSNNFALEVEGYDLVALLEIVKGYENLSEIGLNHNEFEPDNFIVKDGTVMLYHGERASARSIRFFDVAVLYTKLYYTHKNPELAKRYLKTFMSLYKGDLEYFKKSFKVMVASRLIGGYWDFCRNYENDIVHLEYLREDLLSDVLFS